MQHFTSPLQNKITSIVAVLLRVKAEVVTQPLRKDRSAYLYASLWQVQSIHLHILLCVDWICILMSLLFFFFTHSWPCLFGGCLTKKQKTALDLALLKGKHLDVNRLIKLLWPWHLDISSGFEEVLLIYVYVYFWWVDRHWYPECPLVHHNNIKFSLWFTFKWNILQKCWFCCSSLHELSWC